MGATPDAVGMVPPGRRRLGLAAVLVISVLMAIAAAEVTPRFETTGVRGQKAFHIRARAWGLYPGATKDFQVKLTNGSREPIDVTSLEVVQAATVDGPGCPAARYLSTTAFAGSIVVSAKTSLIVTDALSITLDASAPDDCQDAGFRLRLRGEATGG
jgi:hypothetical protein